MRRIRRQCLHEIFTPRIRIAHAYGAKPRTIESIRVVALLRAEFPCRTRRRMASCCHIGVGSDTQLLHAV